MSPIVKYIVRIASSIATGYNSRMGSSEMTCWTLIHAAGAGEAKQRDEFACRYDPTIRRYLAARWRDSLLLNDIDDAVQETFVECFRQGGALERADHQRAGGFRAFLYGIVRNVALRCEQRRAKEWARQPAGEAHFSQIKADETNLSRVFDRAWARSILQQAAQQQTENAKHSGSAAEQRVELLRRRFHEGLPIREIAQQWKVDATELHREYAKARKEFKQALHQVVTFHQPNQSAADVERECAELLKSLG